MIFPTLLRVSNLKTGFERSLRRNWFVLTAHGSQYYVVFENICAFENVQRRKPHDAQQTAEKQAMSKAVVVDESTRKRFCEQTLNYDTFILYYRTHVHCARHINTCS